MKLLIQSVLVYLPFQVSGELSTASPERLSMASPGVGGGKRVHNLPYSSDVNQSRISLCLFSLCLFSSIVIVIAIFLYLAV